MLLQDPAVEVADADVQRKPAEDRAIGAHAIGGHCANGRDGCVCGGQGQGGRASRVASKPGAVSAL
eukprot:2690245-Prymnesium_polylepis.1